jgi:redox-sensitive bicupin YhaK (pirin superfamily)
VGAGAPTSVPQHTLAVLGDGSRVSLQAGSGPARAILVAGRPLREPVARYGPFVMNTQEQLRQAFQDYQDGRF